MGLFNQYIAIGIRSISDIFLCLTGRQMGRRHHFVVGVYIMDGEKIEGNCISKDNVAGDGCQISRHVGDIRGAISRPQLVTYWARSAIV